MRPSGHDAMSLDVAKEIADAKKTHTSAYHAFGQVDITFIREKLLAWAGTAMRSMSVLETIHKAHKERTKVLKIHPIDVWISEIMLQQTQVKTVIAYYNKWMQAWPTIFDLAESPLTAVNEVWAGLGYYSRAKRIHEAACYIVDEHAGILPSTGAELQANVPGIGPYTAGAIASIAYHERAELVDGNVVRIFSRLRAIGANPKSKTAVKLYWALAKELVDPDRPGDFNQALMEYGAMVCTPKSPLCRTCSIQASCHAFAEATAATQLSENNHSKRLEDHYILPDLEDYETTCAVCDEGSGVLDDHAVTRYPMKVIRKKPRRQDTAVCILQRDSTGPSLPGFAEYLLIQRPATGLLGGLWEFPSVDLRQSDSDEVKGDRRYEVRKRITRRYIADILGYSPFDSDDDAGKIASVSRDLGNVKHLFSHIEQTYWAEHVVIPDRKTGLEVRQSSSRHATKLSASSTAGDVIQLRDKQGFSASKSASIKVTPLHKWVSADALSSEALPTGMRKVFALKDKASLARTRVLRTTAGVSNKRRRALGGSLSEH